MAIKYFGESSIVAFIEILKERFNQKVDVKSGYALSKNDFNDTYKNKLDGIEDSAEVNVLEKITVNGVAVSLENKEAKISIPDTSLPDGLKTGYVTTGVAENESLGTKATAEGISNIASGIYSHAEGMQNRAEAIAAHAEGKMTNALGLHTHAEGLETSASGSYSHAEGYSTQANGSSSHAQNLGTIAAGSASTAIGKYNLQDDNGDYSLQIGGGKSSAERADILTVNWSGDVTCGKVNGINTSTLLTTGELNTHTEGTAIKILTTEDIDTSTLITTTTLGESTILTSSDIDVSTLITTENLDVSTLVTTNNIATIIENLPSVDGVQY